jgi:Flp pilus assembly protein TadD
MKGRFFRLKLSLACPLWIASFVFYASFPVRAQENLASQASTLMQEGNFHDAEVLWRKLEERYPKNPTFHGNLGVALAQQGQLAQAVTEYRTSLALNPKQPEVAFSLGAAEFKEGHFNQAIRAFKTAARLNPADHRSTLLIGMSYYGLRRFVTATPYLQAASVAA